MSSESKIRRAPIVAAMSLVAAASLVSTEAWSLDADAAQGMARQNKCVKCHALDKKNVGPSFKDVAAKYKGNKDAEVKLTKHVTGGGKYKDEEGREKDHPAVKSKDPDEIKNLVGWILSR